MIWIERRTGLGGSTQRLHQKKIMNVKKTGNNDAEKSFNKRGRPINV